MFDEKHVVYRYKYLPFTDGSLRTLTDGTIKFTCPLDFNDPFDCFPFFDTTNIGEYPRRRPELFKAAAKQLGLSPAKRIQQKGALIARVKERIESGRLNYDLLKKIGVVSLSRDPVNILMWSHYADFHRGFVLEFRIPTMGTRDDVPLAVDRLLPLPIRYQARRPNIDAGAEFDVESMKRLVFTKSDIWKYEQEERVFDLERGPGIRPYRRDEILCSVISGMRTSDSNYRKLNEIVSRLGRESIPHLALYRAEPKNDEYMLLVKGHPRIGFLGNHIDTLVRMSDHLEG